jgi:hypothetical protein
MLDGRRFRPTVNEAGTPSSYSSCLVMLFTSRAHVTRRPTRPTRSLSLHRPHHLSIAHVTEETGAAPTRCMTECIPRMNHEGLCFPNAHQRALP